MDTGALQGQVALVTGASRGIGKGIAVALGRAGATVYVTGRTEDESKAAVPMVTGTIHATAAAVTAAGGKGIAIRCDHADDVQVRAAVERVVAEQGRIDILVNNAWRGYEGYSNDRHLPPQHPFWQKPLMYWDEQMDGVRWAYIATALAAPQLVAQGRGLVINISVDPGFGDAAYSAAKAAVNRLTGEFAQALKPHGIAVAGLLPGLVRTEIVLINAQYFDMTQSESTEFTGRAVVALATDAARMDKSGVAYVVAELAREYGFTDEPYTA